MEQFNPMGCPDTRSIDEITIVHVTKNSAMLEIPLRSYNPTVHNKTDISSTMLDIDEQC